MALVDPILQAHFVFTVNDVSFGYCYIRKNGCSCFKQLMQLSSDVEEDALDGMDFMRKHHSLQSLQQFLSAQYRILVLREPLDRLVSCWNNKMVQQSANEDICGNIRMLTGMDVEKISFRDFVVRYVALAKKEFIDSHVMPQATFTFPQSFYNLVVPLQELNDTITELIPENLFKKCFAVKRNVSSDNVVASVPSGILDAPVSEFQKKYLKDGTIPDFKLAVDEELRILIKDIFSEDYALYDSALSQADSRSPDERYKREFFERAARLESALVPETAAMGAEQQDLRADAHDFSDFDYGSDDFLKYVTWLLKNDHGLALARIQSLLSLNVPSAPLRAHVGRFLFNLGEVSLSATTLESAIELDPAYPSSYAYLSYVYARQTKYKEALTAAQQAVALGADFPNYHAHIGNLCIRVSDYAGAEDALTKALDSNSELHLVHYNLSLVHAWKTEFERALDDVNRAITLQDGNSIYYQQQGDVLVALKRYPEAEEAFHKAIALHTDNIQLHFKLSCLYGLMNDNEKALREGESVLRLSDNFRYFHHVAAILRKMGNEEKAEQALLEAASRHPAVPQCFIELCTFYEETGRPKQAIEALRKATALQGVNVSRLQKLAELHMLAGEHKRAEEALIAAVKLRNESQGRNKFVSLYDVLKIKTKMLLTK